MRCAAAAAAVTTLFVWAELEACMWSSLFQSSTMLMTAIDVCSGFVQITHVSSSAHSIHFQDTLSRASLSGVEVVV